MSQHQLCDAVVTPTTLTWTQSQVICFLSITPLPMSALWATHIVKYLNCEWKTALTTQHLPTAIMASLQVSSQYSSGDAKWCDREPTTGAVTPPEYCSLDAV